MRKCSLILFFILSLFSPVLLAQCKIFKYDKNCIAFDKFRFGDYIGAAKSYEYILKNANKNSISECGIIEYLNLAICYRRLEQPLNEKKCFDIFKQTINKKIYLSTDIDWSDKKYDERIYWELRELFDYIDYYKNEDEFIYALMCINLDSFVDYTKELIPYCEELLSRNPANLRYHLAMYRILKNNVDDAKKISIINSCVQIAENNPGQISRSQLSILYYLKSESYDGDANASISDLKKAIDYDRTNFKVIDKLLSLFLKETKDYAAVIQYFGYYSQFNDLTNIITYRAEAKQELGDHRGAIQDFTKYIVSWNNAPYSKSVYFNRAYSKYKLNDYNGAITDLNVVITSKETEKRYAYFLRGLCKLKLNQKNSGCLDLIKAGELGFEDAYESIQRHCN